MAAPTLDGRLLVTAELQLGFIRWQFKQITANHSIGCGSGDTSAVAPTGVCPQPQYLFRGVELGGCK